MNKKQIKSKRVNTPRNKAGNESFVVVHTSGSHVPRFDFFDDNNTLVKDKLTLLRESTNEATKMLAERCLPPARAGANSTGAGGGGGRRLASKKKMALETFKKDIDALTERCSDAEVLTVKCIRANDSGAPLEFDDAVVSRQLEDQGVIDVCTFRGNWASRS